MLGPTNRAELPQEAVLTKADIVFCRHCTVPTLEDGWAMMLGSDQHKDQWREHSCPLCGQRYLSTESLDTFDMLVRVWLAPAEDDDD